jgi:hypothetical protein
MDMNESSEKGMEGNGSSGVEWQSQFSGGFSTQQHHAHMMDSFAAASGMWAAPSAASQNMSGLSDVNGMSSAARGAGFLAPVPGFLPPPGLGAHFPVDSGFIERAARSSCFVGPGAGGGMMGGFGCAGDQHMGSAFGGASDGYLDHRRNDDKAEPELAGSGGVPSLESAGGYCSSKGSDSKKRRRPSEVCTPSCSSFLSLKLFPAFSSVLASGVNRSELVLHSGDGWRRSGPVFQRGR